MGGAGDNTMDDDRGPRPHLDASAEVFLQRTYEMASGPISGFNDTAAALAAEANGDRRVIEQARREVLHRLRERPDHLTKQAASLLQRALELGDWNWE